jgi:uncharacterized membrane protein YfcA
MPLPTALWPRVHNGWAACEAQACEAQVRQAQARFHDRISCPVSLDLAWVLVLGLLAGTVGGVIGFGASVILMPALVLVFGPREAVPIMAVASIMANASRVLVWWREVDVRCALAYSLTAAPAAALGAATLLRLPPGVIEGVLGIFFIAMVPVRRWMSRQSWRLGLWHMALVGGVVGYITGMVVSTGPINAPFFLAYGLVKGAFLATEALGSLAMFIAKAATFGGLGALPMASVGKGLVIGSALMIGSWLAKRWVLRLDPAQFRYLIEGMLLLAGVTMLWAALS